MTYDVAIVGAGIVGAACADALAREGMSVAVVDGPDPFSRTTAAGMGHIVVMDDSEAQFALTSYSRTLWEELAKDLPSEAELSRCGTLWIAADGEELSEAERKHDYYTGRGVKAAIIDAAELREAEPGLREGLAGALHVPGDLVVYQPCAASFLLHRARKNGAKIFPGRVISALSDGIVEDWSGERFEALHLIVAAGCGSTDLVPSLEMRRRKGHLVITGRTDSRVSHQLVELGYVRSAHGADNESVAFNIQPRVTGQLLIGSSRQYDSEDGSVELEVVKRMIDRAVEYFPSAANAHATRIWTGFRPSTRDGLPYIGKVPGFERVYAATGHEGLGITTSLATAALLADEIAGRESAIPRAPYSPERLDG